MNTDTYFKIFKIEKIKTITLRELKRRYGILAKKYHPDRGGNHNKMVLINDAYKYLIVLVRQNIKKQDKLFFNNKYLIFYGDGSIYDKKKSRWIRLGKK